MSKKVFQHPAPREGAVQPWRSLEERNKSPEFLTRAEREFVDGASAAPSPVERREFLTLMGASFGLAGLGLAGCREPRHHTLPYAKQPENTIPGIPTYYASSFPGEFAGYEIVTKENVGRARIDGTELSYKQSLHFLPGWGENLQFFANASFVKPSGGNAADFSRYSKKIYNWGLNFARGKIYARMNWNQRPGDLLEPLGTDPNAPKSWSATRTMVSLDVEYRLSRRFSVYGTANNVTDAPEFGRRFAPSTPDYARITSVSVYGTDFTVGIRGSF